MYDVLFIFGLILASGNLTEEVRFGLPSGGNKAKALFNKYLTIFVKIKTI